MIVTRGVNKAYGGTVVVNDVSLALRAGGVTSVIGPNGAGKSTLLSMISRLLGMDAGSIQVDGLDVAATPTRQLAQRLAVLRQDNHISARLTVQDLVAFGRYPHNRGRPRPEDQAHVDRAIAYLGLEEVRARYLDELSGGQRQRVYVAQGMAQDHDVLLLDEPLTGLDIVSARIIDEIIHDETHAGRTVVHTTHDLDEARAADHVVLMAGRVVAYGPPAQVLTEANLREAYNLGELHEPGGIFIDSPREEC